MRSTYVVGRVWGVAWLAGTVALTGISMRWLDTPVDIPGTASDTTLLWPLVPCIVGIAVLPLLGIVHRFPEQSSRKRRATLRGSVLTVLTAVVAATALVTPAGMDHSVVLRNTMIAVGLALVSYMLLPDVLRWAPVAGLFLASLMFAGPETNTILLPLSRIADDEPARLLALTLMACGTAGYLLAERPMSRT